MVTLRWRLDKIFEGLGGTLRRETAVLLLRAISESLKPATRVSGSLGGARNHPAIDLLDEFNDVLADLARGKLNPLLKPAPIQAGRALSLKKLREDKSLLELVQRTAEKEGLTTTEAEQRVATKFEALH